MPQVLHSLERRLLQTLAELRESSLEDAASHSKMHIDQARRAVEWLRSKGLIEAVTVERREVNLESEGWKAVKLNLPERRIVETLLKMGGRAGFAELQQVSGMSGEEFSAAVGHAVAIGWLETLHEEGRRIVVAASKPEASVEEMLLERASRERVFYEELSDSERTSLEKLRRRPAYLSFKVLKSVRLKLTPSGLKAAARVKRRRELEKLTPELLTAGGWRKHILRPIDVESPVPIVTPGKKHPVQRFIDEVREIFVSLGFEEVEGPLVQPCFWNFDALFIPQDHPAREMQDTFYISGVDSRTIEASEWVADRVAEVHKDGGNTGSKGWGYEWSPEDAKKLVLRTHTTAVTVKYLADHHPEEAKVFSVGRVFRNEKVTFKNLVEFHQIEGIAVGRRVTLRDMMGLLSCFYSRLGLKKVKFWPSYFPYTEPSLQSVVYVEKFDRWVELCGMGIFRPEVTLPMGVKEPVLAWGGGLERLVMLRYGVEDVRQLYENNLGWLREIPLCR